MTANTDIPLTAVAPGRWTTRAGDEWSNPGGGLWGGYAIGLAIRAIESEPEAIVCEHLDFLAELERVLR